MRLLFWIYVLILVSTGTGVCIEPTPTPMNESMPLIIYYSHGACHAEWGRTDIRIESEGVCLYESGSGNLILFEDGQRYENEDFRKTFALNETELKDLLYELEKSGFYSLNDSYYNPEVRDGSCEGISITENNSTKSVSVSNIAAPQAYERAVDLIEGMAKNKTHIVPYSSKTFDYLIADLNDSDRDVRAGAASELGDFKDARAVDPLIAALHDCDHFVRWRAALALGKINDSRAVVSLIEALNDSD
ncbi:MAG: HEAT repeat domain-containing protein, partial [Methanothrix sp.]|nr:HEAT repeat domain-containing protein [Methanothrix sp.]